MRIALAALVSSSLITGCAMMGSMDPSATAELQSTRGSTVSGTVTFSQQWDKILVVASVSGLKPGAHGFHIHEKATAVPGTA